MPAPPPSPVDYEQLRRFVVPRVRVRRCTPPRPRTNLLEQLLEVVYRGLRRLRTLAAR
jgi:hypothetical protein